MAERDGVVPGTAEKGVEGARAMVWNVRGLRKKDKEFWRHVRRNDIVGLVETWVLMEDWDRVKRILPKEFVWRMIGARKEKVKGRAMGGIITGVRRDLAEWGADPLEFDWGMERKVIVGREGRWRILFVYNCGG